MNTKDIIAEIQSIIDSKTYQVTDPALIEPESKASMMTTYIDMGKHCDELLCELAMLRIQMAELEYMISEVN